MGLPAWMHWLCWFINVVATCTLSILIIVILVSIEFKAGTGAVLAYSNPLLTFVFLMLYASSLILFLFFISTFFDKRKMKSTQNVLLLKVYIFSKLGFGHRGPYSHLDLLHPQQSDQQNIRWVHQVLIQREEYPGSDSKCQSDLGHKDADILRGKGEWCPVGDSLHQGEA